MGATIRILGIDPGSRVTGFGVVESDGIRTRYLASGCIRARGDDLDARLGCIFEGVRDVVSQWQPCQVAVERVFVSRNADSALKLGQARGAAICATLGAGAELHEYAARAVKQAVVGRGSAEKGQVQHMIRAILNLDGLPASDEADALAVALCHAHQWPLEQRKRAAVRAGVGQ
jgi:crossover junction endodeoxyribonuclease RuvC